jgi:hypothetical protein
VLRLIWQATRENPRRETTISEARRASFRNNIVVCDETQFICYMHNIELAVSQRASGFSG